MQLKRPIFTPTQQKIVDILADGEPHLIKSFLSCLPDKLSGIRCVYMHVGAIRKVLRQKGQDIIVENIKRRNHYRHICLLSPAAVYRQEVSKGKP